MEERHLKEKYDLGYRHGLEKALVLVNSCDTIVGRDRHRKSADTGVFLKRVVIDVLTEELDIPATSNDWSQCNNCFDGFHEKCIGANYGCECKHNNTPPTSDEALQDNK